MGTVDAPRWLVDVTGIAIDRFDEYGRLLETWEQWDDPRFMDQLLDVSEHSGVPVLAVST